MTTDSDLIAITATLLDRAGCTSPIVVICENSGEVFANYSKEELHFRNDASAAAVTAEPAGPTEFRTPSIAAAIAFLSEVEALRQEALAPYLLFASMRLQEKIVGQGYREIH